MKIDALKRRGGYQQKRNDYTISCHPIVKATNDYYECALIAKFTFLKLLLFHSHCFLLTPKVFLPLFAGELHKGR